MAWLSRSDARVPLINARGGKEDVFRIASDTSREFGHMIHIVEAAEMLNFVDTPKRLVILTPALDRLVEAAADERKSLWRQRLLQLQLFQVIHEALRRQPDHKVERDLVPETIMLRMPQENPEAIFNTFIGWARFGNLFAYDELAQMVSLQ